MAKDFDTTLSDAIDLAAAAAQTAGASAARVRGRKRAVRRRVAVSTASFVLVAVGATAAFKAASTGGGGTPHVTAASPQVTASAGPSVVASPSAVGTSSSQDASGVHACGGGDLAVQEGRTESADGHYGMFLLFTNESGRTCTVQGNPTVVVTGGSGVLATATPVLNGFLGPREVPGAPRLIRLPLVTVAPGGTAMAVLELEGNAGQACYGAGEGTLRVTVPGTSSAVSVGAPFTVGGSQSCSNLEINPIVTDPDPGQTSG